MADDIAKFATAIASGLSMYMSNVYKMDNVTYASLNTVVAMVMIFALTQAGRIARYFKDIILGNIELGVATYIAITACAVVAVSSVALYLLRYKIKKLIYNKFLKRYQNIKVTDDYMIYRFVDYMRANAHFYNCVGNIVYKDNMIQYHMIDGEIYFNDTTYDISGTIIFEQYIPLSAMRAPVAPAPAPTPAQPATTTTDAAKTTDAQAPQPVATMRSDAETKYILTLKWCVVGQSQKCKNVIDYFDLVMKHRNEINSLVTIRGNDFTAMKEYINLNRRFYTSANTFDVRNEKLDANIFFKSDTTTEFNDKLFHVNGFMKWTPDNDGTIILLKYNMKPTYSVSDYIADINEWVVDNRKNGGQIVQYHVDKTYEKDVVKVMYDKDSKPLEYLEKTYIDTFFHKDRDMLWKLIKFINYDPERIISLGQSPRGNFMLYGPPGTGKSNFAYRVAMATKRHLLNVKISKYTKAELFDMFTRPKIKTVVYQPREVVFVLDEFDIDMEKILSRQAGQEEQLDVSKEFMKKIFDNDASKKDVCFVPAMQTAQPVAHAPKPTLEDAIKEADGKITKVEEMMKGIAKIYDTLNKVENSIVTYGDLLTLFQGAVPIDGCIIFAMTNKFEELQERYPALFRDGRMTPINFGNFDLDMVNRISKYYFNRPTTLKVNKEYQPSTVTKILTTAMLSGKNFEYFMEQMQLL